jgi:type III restriction enzyme
MHLIDERGFHLDELAYRKFRLRGALERKLADGLQLAKQRQFNFLTAHEEEFETARGEHAVVFEQGRYAYDFPYSGYIRLKRHFFPVIGNLKADGEEFECAELIANQLTGVVWWLRNVEKKPGSFWLQTSSDRFYPDFIIKMNSGLVLAVEYKGAHIADTYDTREKEMIGKLWAARSGGKCGFIMVKNKNWDALRHIPAYG